MRVLLIDPPDLFLKATGDTRQVQPLGLAYIGAYVAQDHDVRFLLPDTRAYTGDDPWGEIRRALEAEAPDVIGLTCVTAMLPSALRVAREAKRLNPDVVVVLGGTHAASDPLGTLRMSDAIDLVVVGEGEETFAELLGALERARGGGPKFRPEAIASLVWRDADGHPHRNPNRPSIEDLDALPFPLRAQLVWPDDIQPGFYQAMITLRGCPYRCIYCAVPSSHNKLTRYRSPANVVDEIVHLRHAHNIPYLFFHDSVFTLHRGRTVDILDQMLARDAALPFACQTRTDRVDPDLLDRMKAAGCHQIFFGIESGDVGSLKKIRKKMSLDSIRQAVREVKARGIRCTGFFMVGFPWEDEALIRRTADFACDLDLDAVSLFSATPLPGTELWDMAGGDHLPDSIDFTTPQVSLTGLGPDAYRALFDDVKRQLDAYNIAQMQRQLASLQARLTSANAHPDAARRSWLDG